MKLIDKKHDYKVIKRINHIPLKLSEIHQLICHEDQLKRLTALREDGPILVILQNMLTTLTLAISKFLKYQTTCQI